MKSKHMIRILQIRETPLTKCAGVDANCQGLIELFAGDEEVLVLPTIDYTRHTVPLLHQYYLDKKEICRSIEEEKPDVIHIHGAYSFTLIVAVHCCIKYGIPIVFSPHFHPFWALRRPFMGRVFFELITKKVLQRISSVFTINDEDTKIFSRYHNNVIKIPHWSRFSIPPTKPQKNPKMILFVGRLNESNKGFEHLYYLPEGEYEIHCVGKGDVKIRSDMVKHTNISNEELVKLYQVASLLVVPSRYEAFSFVTLEALANYTPVVVSDRVRIIDYISNEKGVNCFKYQNYADFVEKVRDTLGNDVEPHALLAHFSPRLIKKQYKQAYLSAVKH